MKKVQVNEAIIGSTVVEPVIKDGVLLCAPGLIVSRSVQRMLKAFDVQEIVVSTIYSEHMHNIVTDFNKLNELTRISLQHLEIDNVILCAKGLVANLLESEDNKLLDALITYDEGTYHHSRNVAILSLTCGIKHGLTKSELYTLTLGALLHDIGKTLIPVSILNKEDKLTDEEFALIKQHPLLGAELLRQSTYDMSPIIQIVHQHHENWDGTGYPRKLFELHSYRLARIVHIADVYEALCAKRSYKSQIPRHKVREIMREESGKMFDPNILRTFLQAVPAYFVGEEVHCGSKHATVISCNDGENPDVFYNKVIPLTEFEQMCGEEVAPVTLKLIR